MSTASTLLATFGTTDYLLPMALEDLNDEDSRRRARGDEGPSIAWAVGHLLNYRLYVMELLGSPREENPYAGRFAEAEATDGRDYPTVAELLDEWNIVAMELRELVGAKGEEDFDRALEGSHDEKSLRELITFLAWHEGYHMGTMGAQLKAMGYLGPAEKLMARRERDS